MSRYFSNDLVHGGYVVGPSSLVASVGIFLLIDILGCGGDSVDVVLVSGSFGGGVAVVLVLVGRLDPSVSLICIKPGSGLFSLGRRG